MSEDREIGALKARLAELEAKKAAVPLVERKAKEPPSIGVTVFVIGAAVAVVALLAAAQDQERNKSPASAKPSGAGSGILADAGISPAMIEAAHHPWNLSSEPDAVRGGEKHFACTTALTPVRLDFPYSTQNPTLCLRNQPSNGLDVYIQLPQGGQFDCSSIDGCSIAVKFAGRAAQHFRTVTGSGGDNAVLFMTSPRPFMAAMSKSKTAIVELPLYQAGIQQVGFDTQDFQPAKIGLGATTRKRQH